MTIHGREYVEGMGRNEGEEHQHSHLYEVIETAPQTIASLANLGATSDYAPMCLYAWNRSDGHAFSIFRGHRGGRGLCQHCLNRANANLPPVRPTTHKTKWL